MAEQPKSLFSASREAARMVQQDRPLIEFARSNDDRIRDHLFRNGYSAEDCETFLRGYRLVSSARKHLGIK